MDTDFMNTALLENKLNPKCWWKRAGPERVTDPVCLNELKALIDRLEAGEALTKDEWVRLIDGRSPELAAYLFPKAQAVRERVYGTDVYVRGLIEYSNYCKNNCLYCGIRAEIRTQAATGFPPGIFYPAAKAATRWVFVPSSFRAEKIHS